MKEPIKLLETLGQSATATGVLAVVGFVGHLLSLV